MNILIIGATGPTGKHLVHRALEAGDHVTIMARRPEAVDDTLRNRVTILSGDATSRVDVAKAMKGQDALCVTIGTGTGLKANQLFSKAAHAIVDAAQQVGLRRVVWMSSFGVGETYRDASFVQKLMYSFILKDLYKDKAASEETLTGSNLDWTLVYPSALTNDPAKGQYTAAPHVAMRGMPRISRQDVANYMYAAIADKKLIRQRIVITD